jgi:hypothetical protein
MAAKKAPALVRRSDERRDGYVADRLDDETFLSNNCPSASRKIVWGFLFCRFPVCAGAFCF